MPTFGSRQHCEVYDKLKEVFPYIKIITEHHIGQRLFLDIYIPQFKAGIEVNGAQHYKFIPFFHGSEDRFEEYKMLDMKKIRLCTEQGIGLYIVKYDEVFDIDDFIQFINTFLRE